MTQILLVKALANPHTHLRQGYDIIGPLVEQAIHGGARLLGPMPNTEEGLMTALQVMAYTDETCSLIPCDTPIHIVPFLQITERTTKADVDACVKAGIKDAKVYPKGRTTESHNGVAHYMRILPIVLYAGERGVRVHFHPEHPSFFDNRDAEYVFLPIVDIFLHETDAIIFWEHGTDARCIPHWEEWAKTGRFYVTITGHHLVGNETNTYGDVQATCKPPYRTEMDRRGLIGLIGKGYRWVMAGGDDAPHPQGKKHRLGPCACGAYTAPFLMPLYAHALQHLLQTPSGKKIFERFTSENALDLYQPKMKWPSLTLVRRPFLIPDSYQIGPWIVEPFWAGQQLDYSLES